jgi:phage-related minor tail protein
MGSAISKSNKDYINDNWEEIKCSPLGPFLQMIGIAPGNASDTSSLCKSAEFSSQFNSGMTEHINMTNKLTDGLNSVSTTMNKFRVVLASMEQRAFDDMSNIATQIFNIYVKIGNIFYVMVKNLINIMSIFKATVNLGASITKLLIAFINLLRVPVNSVIGMVDFFTRGI